MPRAHCLQHVPFEGPGSIERWLAARGAQTTSTRFFAGDRLPAPAALDLLVVLGGPMSVNDEREYPWLAAEKAFIRSCIDAGTAVLGICLGAQLIASAMGARVFPNATKEIGWFAVHGLSPGGDGVFGFPPVFDAFHWHGETFDLPAGAVRLARSEACENQAFQLGRKAIGLQFHLETTPESAQQIVAQCRHELQRARWVQDESAILAASAEQYRALNRLMSDVLAHLWPADGAAS